MELHTNIFTDSSLTFQYDHSWLACESRKEPLRIVEPVVMPDDEFYDLLTHDRGWVDAGAPDGRVCVVLYPDGKRRTFDYAPSGELIKFSTKDGGSWRKSGDVWNYYDKAGGANGQTLPAGSSLDVDRYGNFVFIDAYGQQTVEGPDGSLLVRAEDGKVSKVTQPDGNTKHFEYGPTNELVKFTTKSGSYWKNDGCSWNHFDANGIRTGKSLGEGSICHVDQRGNFIFTEKNGTKTIEAPDGSVVIKSVAGQVVWVTQPDGAFKSFEYDQYGELIQFSTTNDAYCRKDEFVWCHFDKAGNFTGEMEDEGTQIKVDSDGNFVITYVNGRKEITHVNGSFTVKPQVSGISDLWA